MMRELKTYSNLMACLIFFNQAPSLLFPLPSSHSSLLQLLTFSYPVAMITDPSTKAAALFTLHAVLPDIPLN